MRGRQAPRSGSAAGGRSAELMPARRLKEPLSLEVQWQGGPESKWVLRFRGIYRTYPGCLCIDDVLMDLYAERWAVKTPKRAHKGESR